MTRKSPPPSVLIVGAGPTGLALAGELALRGVACTVVDRRREPSDRSRAFGLLPVTLDQLDARGLADAMVRRGLPWAVAPFGDGTDRGLSFAGLRGRFPFMLIIPQDTTERVLEEAAAERGAVIRRGVRVETLRDLGDRVRVGLRTEGAEPRERDFDFVVGCDGVRSTVRAMAAIPFRGRDYPDSLIVADVELSQPPSPAVSARSVDRGMVALFPFPDGGYRVVVEDHERMDVLPEVAVSPAELRDSMRAILGTDHGLARVRWASRYRSQQRQATAYVSGRLLLAGDAAHTHVPSGGQGLQAGIADAMNLGWKLAAVAHGADADLLATYERERHPVAAAALRKTDLLYRFNTASSRLARAVRWAGLRACAIPAVHSSVVRDIAGHGLAYPSARSRGDSSQVGRRFPDLRVSWAVDSRGASTGGSRLAELLRLGGPVLLTPPGSPAGRTWGPITTAALAEPSPAPRRHAVLVRPDGFVAWTGDGDAPPVPLLRSWGLPAG